MDEHKKNIVRNLERKIGILTTEDEEKRKLKDSMWGIMERYGCKKKHKERMEKKLKDKYTKEGKKRREMVRSNKHQKIH